MNLSDYFVKFLDYLENQRKFAKMTVETYGHSLEKFRTFLDANGKNANLTLEDFIESVLHGMGGLVNRIMV